MKYPELVRLDLEGLYGVWKVEFGDKSEGFRERWINQAPLMPSMVLRDAFGDIQAYYFESEKPLDARKPAGERFYDLALTYHFTKIKNSFEHRNELISWLWEERHLIDCSIMATTFEEHEEIAEYFAPSIEELEAKQEELDRLFEDKFGRRTKND